MDTSAYLSLFLQECRDNCAEIEQLLLNCEQKGATEMQLSEIMRLCHSCKGSSATMGFEKMAGYFHKLEDVISASRDNLQSLTSSTVDVVLRVLDELEQALKVIEATSKEPENYPVASSIDHLLQSADENGSSVQAADETDASAMQLPHVRVDSRRLDALLDLSGELSLLRQQFRTLADKEGRDSGMVPLVDRLEKNVQELVFHVNQSRLIPLDQVFARFPRLVRDLSRSQQKNVHFEMQGTDIELDKSIVDHLVSPLIHLLRNAVDHGIETPEERKKAGKPEEGRLTITVRRDAGVVVVGVEDDGRAIELDDVKKTARQRGFTEDEIAMINDNTLLDLLCSARFSSSQNVSMVSGRGVGLSAVKSTADMLGGTLTLTRSAAMKRFELTLPLHLSVIQVIFIRVNGQTYGVPFTHVERLLHVSNDECRKSLDTLTIEFEGMPITLFPLASALGLTEAAEKPNQPTHPVLVVKDHTGCTGLLVDDILHNEEVMVKPITHTANAQKFYSGCSLLGDGTVTLILDISSLIQHSAQSLRR